MPISSLAKNQWKEYSMSVITDRAIPSFIDGLKPVQRYLLYAGLKEPNTEKKVAAWAGNLAELGYSHGEVSGADALVKMTSEYLNNIPLFTGRGNFGTFLAKDAAAAPRYIFAKLSKITSKIFLDNDQLVQNPDPEQKPPLYYLPIIPMVLVNGIKGIATGWAVDIPPHDPISIIDCLINICNKKPFGDIKPKYPYFNGVISGVGNCYELYGLFERQDVSKLHITELPPTLDQETYQGILDKLEEKGIINGYEDNSKGDKYDITISVKRKAVNASDEDIYKTFKLKATHTWNVNTITKDNKLKEWDPKTVFKDILKEFYAFRLPFIAERIERIKTRLSIDIAYCKAYIAFANDVIAKKFDFHCSEEDMEFKLLNYYKAPEKYVKEIMNKPVRSFTPKHVQEAEQRQKDLEEELKYYNSTTPEKEYEKNLKDLKRELVK